MVLKYWQTSFLQFPGQDGSLIACNIWLFPYKWCKNDYISFLFALFICHLASVYVFVWAAPITEGCTRGIFVDPHVQTVFACFQKFRLIQCPREVFRDGDGGGTSAPTPSSRAPLKSSCPVVQVATPVCLLNYKDSKGTVYTACKLSWLTFWVVTKASLFLLGGENNRSHAETTTFLNVLLPGDLEF